jgi:hypothetical protein
MIFTFGVILGISAIFVMAPTISSPPQIFNDAVFRVYDNNDASKQLALQISGVTTNTTQTLTIPDTSSTIFTSDGYTPLGGYLDMAEITVPAAPAANILRLFVEDTNGFSYFKFIDSTGMQRSLVRDSVILVKNERGTTIAASRIVYASGATGSLPTVDTAKADSLTTMPAIGVTIESIADGAYGRVMQVGMLENVNTSAYNAGDILYVSAATAGVPTTTPPTYPNVRQEIGTVLVDSATVGSIQIVARSILDETIIDHGGLLGLSDDDHTQYLLANGTRALAGAWNLNDQALTNANISDSTFKINGIDYTWPSSGIGTDKILQTTDANVLSWVDCYKFTTISIQDTDPVADQYNDTLTIVGTGGIDVQSGGADIVNVILDYRTGDFALDGGAGNDLYIVDDGHNHTTTSISGLDISDDTNLTAGTNCTLSGDTINVDDAFLINSGADSTTGRLTAVGYTSSDQVVINQSADSDGIKLVGYDDENDHEVQIYLDDAGRGWFTGYVLRRSSESYYMIDLVSDFYVDLGDAAGDRDFRVRDSGDNVVLEINSDGKVSNPYTYSLNVGSVRTMMINSSGIYGVNTSSRRFKENIVDLETSDSNCIYDLRPRKYNRIGSNGLEVGLIAEEVEPIDSKLISYASTPIYQDFPDDLSPDGVRREIVGATIDYNTPETVEYYRLIVPMLHQIQEMNKQMQEMKKEIDILKAK